jgi:NitT/TauT family transport system ATP-binding protein
MLPARLAQKMEGSPPHSPTAPEPPHVTIRGLTKQFGTMRIYDDLDLDLPRGELISVFGPNGCGKSTLINIIAGLIPADAGQILFDGETIDEITFGYVFQNYREALFPWLRAIDNIDYPLKLKGLARRERQDRIERLVAKLGIKIDLSKYPYQMSGGQQQLVSILRAVVVEPEILSKRCRMPTARMSAPGVRRGKAMLSSGSKSHQQPLQPEATGAAMEVAK